jgi:uncharacterized protein YqjF (DUF2071 family)
MSVSAGAATTMDERMRVTERPAETPVMVQMWRDLGFLHWPVDAEAVGRVLPPGLEVDTYDGLAYVGIVPFTIPTTRAMGAVPMVPPFHEINLRTYVHRGGRDPGVWFFSLDAASRLAVAGARLGYALPYFHARIDMHVVEPPLAVEGWGPSVQYRTQRSGVPPAEFRAQYEPTGAVAFAAPGSLEHFLVERYLLYSWNGRVLRSGRVFHSPYPLQPAVATGVSESLSQAAGLPPLSGPPPLVHFARAVEARIYRPRRVGSS